MQSRIGVYRKAFGAEIVESSFDCETRQIGPYTVPAPILYSDMVTNDHAVPWYRLYEEMLIEPTALAAFNVNNVCIGVLTLTSVYEVPIYRDKPNHTDLAAWKFPPLVIKNYCVIGYKRTYPKRLGVNEPLQTILLEQGKTIPEGFTEPLPGTPVFFPPKSIYKAMLEAEADGVWLDKETQEPRFIFNK